MPSDSLLGDETTFTRAYAAHLEYKATTEGRLGRIEEQISNLEIGQNRIEKASADALGRIEAQHNEFVVLMKEQWDNQIATNKILLEFRWKILTIGAVIMAVLTYTKEPIQKALGW